MGVCFVMGHLVTVSCLVPERMVWRSRWVWLGATGGIHTWDRRPLDSGKVPYSEEA